MDGAGAYSGQGFKAQMVALQSLNLMVLRIAPVSVHNKCHMLRDGALFESPYKKLMSLLHDPFCRR